LRLPRKARRAETATQTTGTPVGAILDSAAVPL
jgi:hypothetical protein